MTRQFDYLEMRLFIESIVNAYELPQHIANEFLADAFPEEFALPEGWLDMVEYE